ncbi:MAG: hypothetical protein J6Q14_05850 [Oscillospiraceae bacterium]|nr:hypothetical protein [Oscillospiraceae bacterium]
MRRSVFALAAALMLVGCLTACTARAPEDNNTKMRTAQTGRGYGRYYADDNGDVADGHDSHIGQDIQDATDDIMNDARRMTKGMTEGMNKDSANNMTRK